MSLGAAAASSESPFGSKVRKGMFRTVGQLYKVCFYSVIFCTLQNTTHGRGQNLVRFGWVFYFRNVKISTVVRQWRNSHELYQARTRGTQIIGLSGEHPDLSSGSLFVQFARFRNSYTAIKLHPHIWYITWQSRRDSRS